MKAVNRKLLNLERSNSICPPPEVELLESVQKNDTEKIKTLLKYNKSLLNHEYPSTKTILQIACSEEGVSPETVETLIYLGGNVDGNAEWKPLHLAAQNPNSLILEVIIKHVKKKDQMNQTVDGNTALHSLIKGPETKQNEKLFCRNVELLLEAGIDVNRGDSKNASAILWAAKNGYKHIIQTIFDKSSADKIRLDLDSHKLRGDMTARKLILDKVLYEGPLPEQKHQNESPKDQLLFSLIKQSKEDLFIREFEALSLMNSDNFVDLDDNTSTFLQYGCEKGLTKVVDYLLKKGANVNLVIKNHEKLPIELATENGYFEIFELLLDHPELIVSPEILSFLIKKQDNPKFDKIDHEKCCAILLNKMESNKAILDVNGKDQLINTPIHYSLRYADEDTTRKLLKLGASLACKNNFGTMPIEDIKPEMLENHLDDCIKFNIKNKNDEKRDFEVILDYRTLVPPRQQREKYKFDESNPENDDVTPETEVIAYMSQAPEFKALLKHPVIVSFLFMKWHRIRWLFYTNLIFYILFVLSLLVYIFTYYENSENEKLSSVNLTLTNISWVFLNLTFIILILRELFQITVSPGNYFKNFENYVEIILIFITGMILYINSPSSDTRKQLSSIAILLAAFELVLMFGQHPKLSTNVVMFKTVSVNFFKLLLWYSLLIIAFALSFYILFSKTVVPPNQNSTDADDDEDLFMGPGKSLFKTIVMLTGEFDAGSINFHTYPITSKLIFSLFVFMITIILLNLLNGLAVSDTQTIKNDAELVGHITRAQHIFYVESMLLGNIVPTSVMKIVQNLFCCFPCNRDVTYTFFKPLAKKVCLFTNSQICELCVLPNNHGKIFYESDTTKKRKTSLFFACSNPCSDMFLDKKTVKRVNDIIKRRRSEDSPVVSLESLHMEIASLREKIDRLSNALVQNMQQPLMDT